MDYENIKKHLGEEWLTKQKEMINSKKWIENEKYRDKIPLDPAWYVLEKIEELINKFENVEGFDKWTLEAKTTNAPEDILFELFVLDNLLSKSDSLKLKVLNPESNKESEALITKGNEPFYVEMKKIRDIPNNISNKVDKLFSQASKKFKGSKGILFVGVYNFFKYPEGNPVMTSEFRLLKKLIQQRFNRGVGSSTIAIILVNIFINTSPDFKKTGMNRRYSIIPKPLEKGGLPPKFFEDILEVDGFTYVFS